MPIIFGCQKFSLKVFLSICLIFCQFQPGGAYKSAAFLKQACSEAYCRKASLMLRVSQNTSIQIKLFILPTKKIVEKFAEFKTHAGNLANIKKDCPWRQPYF